MIMNNIIIIDDDGKSTESLELSISLDLVHCKLICFQYPEEFEKANIEDISLIILDIMFAGDGVHSGGYNLGIEFYLKYKQNNPSVPFIIFTNKTANSVGDNIIKLIKDNGDKFIEKPSVSLDDFITIIKERLELKCS